MRFDEATAVDQDGNGVWKAEVQPKWDIFGITNGGYLMAIGARAMSGSAEDRIPVSVTSHFLRPVSAGPVEVAVDEIKRGRTFSTVEATLTAASESMTMLGSFIDPAAIESSDLYVAGAPPDLPPPEDCPRALPNPDGPLPPPIVAQFEERLHPDDATPLEGRPSGVARMRGWFRLHDDEPIDEVGPLRKGERGFDRSAVRIPEAHQDQPREVQSDEDASVEDGDLPFPFESLKEPEGIDDEEQDQRGKEEPEGFPADE